MQGRRYNLADYEIALVPCALVSCALCTYALVLLCLMPFFIFGDAYYEGAFIAAGYHRG